MKNKLIINKIADINYLKNLPFDVIVNHILPYTYSPQSRELLHDIRSFKLDYLLIESEYQTEYNDIMLIYDIYNFCNRSDVYARNMNNDFFNILRRSFILKNKSYSFLNNYSFIHYRRDSNININRKIRTLLCMLTHIERTHFITLYLIRNL
jgi:hypothetical protein